MKDYIPTEDEFDIILAALGHYKVRVREVVAGEEVLRASQRLAAKVPEKDLSNEEAFDDAFSPTGLGASTFIADLTAEIDAKALKRSMNEAEDNVTLLCAKIIRLREQYRKAATDSAISSLLNP